jgi:hypothetical protein
MNILVGLTMVLSACRSTDGPTTSPVPTTPNGQDRSALSQAIERSVAGFETRVKTVRRLPSESGASAAVFMSGEGQEQVGGLAIVRRLDDRWRVMQAELFPGSPAAGGPGFSSFATFHLGEVNVIGGFVDQRSTSVALIGPGDEILDEAAPEQAGIVLVDTQDRAIQIRAFMNDEILSATPVPTSKAISMDDPSGITAGEWERAARTLLSNLTTRPEAAGEQLYCRKQSSQCVDAVRTVLARTPNVTSLDAGPITSVRLSGDGRSALLVLYLTPAHGTIVTAAYDYRLTAP